MDVVELILLVSEKVSEASCLRHVCVQREVSFAYLLVWYEESASLLGF